jgi:hypothetical protein
MLPLRPGNVFARSSRTVPDRYGYDAEKRHALEVWAARLEEILSGKVAASNVVSLVTAGEAQ